MKSGLSLNWEAHINTYKRLDHCNKARLYFEQVTKWQDQQAINTTLALRARNSTLKAVK